MADEEQLEGPRLVWTFPLVTRIQKGSRFLDIGNNLGSLISEGGVVGEDGVGSRVRDRVQEDSSSADISEGSEETMLDSVESQIDDVKEGSELTFGDSDFSSTEDTTVKVEIQDGIFVPTRANIGEGDTVIWVNEDDQVHKISSVEGKEFTSGQLEPGEEFEFTFEEEQTVIYVDTIQGGESMSGAIIVGDSESPETLPSETGPQPIPFSEGSGNNYLTTRNMSVAAEEKQEMNKGFGE